MPCQDIPCGSPSEFVSSRVVNHTKRAETKILCLSPQQLFLRLSGWLWSHLDSSWMIISHSHWHCVIYSAPPLFTRGWVKYNWPVCGEYCFSSFLTNCFLLSSSVCLTLSWFICSASLLNRKVLLSQRKEIAATDDDDLIAESVCLGTVSCEDWRTDGTIESVAAEAEIIV